MIDHPRKHPTDEHGCRPSPDDCPLCGALFGGRDPSAVGVIVHRDDREDGVQVRYLECGACRGTFRY